MRYGGLSQCLFGERRWQKRTTDFNTIFLLLSLPYFIIKVALCQALSRTRQVFWVSILMVLYSVLQSRSIMPILRSFTQPLSLPESPRAYGILSRHLGCASARVFSSAAQRSNAPQFSQLKSKTTPIQSPQAKAMGPGFPVLGNSYSPVVHLPEGSEQ